MLSSFAEELSPEEEKERAEELEAMNLQPSKDVEAWTDALIKTEESELVNDVRRAAVKAGNAIESGPISRRRVLKLLDMSKDIPGYGTIGGTISALYSSKSASRKMLRGSTEFFYLTTCISILEIYEIYKYAPQNTVGPEMMDIGVKEARKAIIRHWKLTDEEKKAEKAEDQRERRQRTRKAKEQAIETQNQAEKEQAVLLAKPAKLDEIGREIFPSGLVITAWLEIIRAGKYLNDLQEKKREINHDTTVKVTRTEGKYKVEYRSKGGAFTLQMNSYDELAKRNNTVESLLIFIFWKLNKQIYNGKLSSPYLTFTLKELKEIGMFNNLDVARRAVNTTLELLQENSLFKAEIKDQKNAVHCIKLGSFFRDIDIMGNGTYCIELRPDIDWTAINQGYAIMPSYIFRLKGRAQDLLLKICQIARQRAADIKSQSCFTVRIKTIYSHLGLPPVEGNDSPKKTIIEPILNAITEIENEQRRASESQHWIRFILICEDGGRIDDFLNGYLEIRVSGTMAEELSRVESAKQNRIETSRKKQERIREKAQTKALAEKLKAENSDSEKRSTQSDV